MRVTTTSDYPANATNMAVCRGDNAASGVTQCSLRAAVGVTNADFSTNGAGTMTIDKIVLPAGTYQITITNNGGTATDEYGSVDYHYDVDGAVNIVGAGQGTTIIEAGTTGYNGSTFGNGIDSLFEQNSQVVNPAGTFDMSLSNLTLANGRNPNIQSASNGYITNFYGGALDFDAYGGGVLTVTNVTVTNNSIVDGAGGGLDVFNTNGTTTSLQGGVDVENSIVTYNQSPFAAGGLFVFDHMLTTINNSTFSYNSATKGSSNQTDSEGLDNVGGGGVYIAGTEGFAALSVTNSTIKNNTTDGIGGGFTYFSGATITNTVFDSNSAAGFGGGIYTWPAGSPLNATGITLTNNSINAVKRRTETGQSVGEPNGAGLCTEPSETNYPATANMNYSRIHGNNADGGAYNGYHAGCGISSGETATTVNLTNNWWGCNGPASGAGCDTAGATTPVSAGNCR